jgi:hypothetical protein
MDVIIIYTLTMKKLYYATCAICNLDFTHTNPNGKKTCSKQCQYKIVSSKLQNKIIRICKKCNQEYLIIPSGRKYFCSQKCQLDYQKTLVGDRNPAWKPINEKSTYRTLKSTLRRKLISADTVCNDCGKSSVCLEIHHIDKNRNNNQLNNLVILCLDCHADRHKGERAERIIRSSKNHSFKLARKAKNCFQCNQLFLPYYDAHKFCSHKCAKKYRDSHTPSKLITSVCPICGAGFTHKPSESRKYCSRPCQYAGRNPSRYRQ